MALPELSFETALCAFRFDDIEEARRISPAGEGGSDSKVFRREEDIASFMEFTVRTDVERCGSSVLEELALDVLMSVNRAPCLDRGGGGGDLVTDKGSLLLGAGLARGASTEC